MKRIILSAAVMLASVCAFAQVGIIGGWTSSSTNLKSAYSEMKSKAINQFHVGVTYKFGLGNIVALQPALIYNVKGANFSELETNCKTGYIELPVQVQAGVGLGKIVRVYGILEPFIGYAVTNSINWEGTVDKTWDNVKDRFEYGLGLGAGVELFSHLQLGLKYFWNFGTIYGADLSYAGVKANLAEGKCQGISISAAILF